MFEKIICSISAGLERYDIPYMLIGGQAVLLYGEPRLTRDIEDVRGILLKMPDIDIAYVRRWLKDFSDTLGENEIKKRFESIIKTL